MENVIMKIISILPRFMQKIICIIITPTAWLLFSVPAQVLKKLGYHKLALTFPLHWGTQPLSILPDIKDRLLAPVNHRFSKKSLRKIINKAGLKDIRLEEDSTGIYGVLKLQK